MRTTLERTLLNVAASAGLAVIASAQAINLDVGDTFTFGSPSSAYAGAAGQAGVWNNASSTTGIYTTSGLLDVNGVVTGVGTTSVSSGNGLADFAFDNPGTTGDDQALMDDLQDVGSGTSMTTWTWSGLANGPYDVYLYAWAPDSSTFFTVIEDPTSGTQIVVGPAGWPGGQVEGQTYGKFCVNVTGGTFSVTVRAATGGGFASVNGWQLVPGGSCGAPGQAFCNGDGSGTACPCGNNNDGSNGVAGCVNSAGAGGGLLTGTGTNSIAAGDLVLSGSTLQPGQAGLYLQGNNATGGGNGVAFGDGLRCAGGGVVRLQIRNSGMAGASFTTVNIASVGGVSAGDVKRYQLWFRDTAGPCGSGFNFTNGYEVTWAP